jgi:hypothetical protein
MAARHPDWGLDSGTEQSSVSANGGHKVSRTLMGLAGNDFACKAARSIER